MASLNDINFSILNDECLVPSPCGSLTPYDQSPTHMFGCVSPLPPPQPPLMFDHLHQQLPLSGGDFKSISSLAGFDADPLLAAGQLSPQSAYLYVDSPSTTKMMSSSASSSAVVDTIMDDSLMPFIKQEARQTTTGDYLPDDSLPSPFSDAGYASHAGSPYRSASVESTDSGNVTAAAAAPLSDDDHQLLRQCLRDTSLQQRLNVQPFDMQLLYAANTAAACRTAQQSARVSSVETDSSAVAAENVSLPDAVRRELPQSKAAVDRAVCVTDAVCSNNGDGGDSCDNGDGRSAAAATYASVYASASWVMQQLGSVFDLAVEEARQDKLNVCRSIAISPDPTVWTVGEVRAWLTYMCRQFDLPPLPTDRLSDVDGPALCSLTEQEFKLYMPEQSADVLYAQLLVWLSSCQQQQQQQHVARPTAAATRTGADRLWSSVSTITSSSAPTTKVAPAAANATQRSGCDQLSCVVQRTAAAGAKAEVPDTDDDDDEDSTTRSGMASSAATTVSGGRTGSTHIHLWQFLRELLGNTAAYGTCIRWIDQANGVFKIEDSVSVARLWGQRKNRPAMNYDKLSRSIRQYYKKGIMRKTERSQRLVYQFCRPYAV